MDGTEVAVKLEAHEHEIGSLKYRVKDLEDQSKALQELVISVNKMAVSIENMLHELTRQSGRLEALEKAPQETGKLVKAAIITALVGGAEGLISESAHTRLVGYALMEKLKDAGIQVVDCTIDKANTAQEYLAAVTALEGAEKLDWFLSLHFNASPGHTGRGVEVYTYKGRRYPEALAVCANIAELGFQDRGIKDGSGLYVIRNTKARAMLIEVCFCDNQKDVDRYFRAGAQTAAAQAVFNAFSEKGRAVNFEDFVGEIAKRDWRKRKIMLPSVVVAQAMKESAKGTSELARNANALFGIKKNGWQGRTYRKTAAEQRPDGSIYTVDDTEWRAYDNWEQSVLDHNNYIAQRSTDGGKTLRYAPVIGCPNYVLACQYLQECGYATALNYAESLISGYIEKYNLTRFD